MKFPEKCSVVLQGYRSKANYGTLTVGKFYEVIKSNPYGSHIKLRNDRGNLAWYNSLSFKRADYVAESLDQGRDSRALRVLGDAGGAEEDECSRCGGPKEPNGLCSKCGYREGIEDYEPNY